MIHLLPEVHKHPVKAAVKYLMISIYSFLHGQDSFAPKMHAKETGKMIGIKKHSLFMVFGLQVQISLILHALMIMGMIRIAMFHSNSINHYFQHIKSIS